MPPLADDTCKNNEAGLRSSGLPADYNSPAVKTCIELPKPKHPCPNCPKCSGKKQGGTKYIQPPVPASYKPEKIYKPTPYPIDSGTVYNLSYCGVSPEAMKECKQNKAGKAQDSIHLSCMPFSQDTVFRLSFTGAPGERSIPCKPLFRNMMGCGPMQSITTHRHDFVPKVSERTLPTKKTNNNNINLCRAKMECATTMTLSYQPVQGEKAVSCKPTSSEYKKSDYKLEQDTIHRLSYQPWEPMPKEECPWRKREGYKPHPCSMDGNTIYRASYLPADCYERAPSCKPVPMPLNTSGAPISSATIYKESYQDNGITCRPVQVVQQGSICLSQLPMSNETTARLSYTGTGGERALPCKPLLRNMMGSGPMQCMTTHRHDYIPKSICAVKNFKPKPTFMSSNFKMEDITTFRASYMPNECVVRTESFKPSTVYKKSEYPLESQTVNRLSFQPVPLMPKEEYPWMKRPRYQQPNTYMDNTSIYRGSYLAPGEYISDGGGYVDEECTCKKQSATEDL